MPNYLISGVKFTVHTVFVVYINTGKTNSTKALNSMAENTLNALCNVYSPLQYLLHYTIPTPHSIPTPLSIQYLLHYIIPTPLYNTDSTIQYLLYYTIPTPLYNTYSTTQYLLH